MKYFWFYVVALLICLVGITYWKMVEGFQARSPHTVVLMGDSTLQNESYVAPGKSVCAQLRTRVAPQTVVVCAAEDHAKLEDVYGQIDHIPPSTPTSIFLSAGGNNLLSHYLDKTRTTEQDDYLETMGREMQSLTKAIHARAPNAKLFLLNLYTPRSFLEGRFYGNGTPLMTVIEEWNRVLKGIAEDPANNVEGMVPLSQLTSPDCLVGIEPSEKGGEKIVDLLMNVL